MANHKQDIRAISFDKHRIPEFKEEKGKDWILFGTGEDGLWRNQYPDYLIELFQRNSKHAAIIRGKQNYICGNGWDVDKTINDLSNTAISLAQIKKVNPDDESLDDITRKIVLDFEIYDGFAIQVIWSKNGKTFDLYHIPFNRIRTNEDHSEYYYCTDWSMINPSTKPEETNWEVIDPFDTKKPKGKQLYYFYIKKPIKSKNKGCYPYPNYIGAVTAIETGIEISNFHLNNIKNGFWAGFLINIFGNATPEEKDKMEEKIKEKFAGSDNAGKFLLNFALSPEKATTLQSLSQADLDKMFIELRKDIDQDLMTGHEVTNMMLFGIKTEGQLGGRTEVVEAYEIFKNTYINTRQRIIESEINYLMKLKGVTSELKLKPVEPITEKFSEDTLIKIMTKDELREKAGLPKLEENQPTGTDNPQPIVEKPVEMDKESEMGACVAHYIQHGKSYEQAVAICVNDPTAYKKNSIQFSKKKFTKEEDERDIEIFKNYGIEKTNIEVLFEENLESHSFETAKERESFLMAQNFAKKEKKEETKIDGKIKTPTGEQKLPDAPKRSVSIQVMYDYQPLVGLQPIIATTRDFCRELITLNRLYTRADIELISSEVGYNVWEHRGGFWRIKGTDETLDHCRHRWVRQIVKTEI